MAKKIKDALVKVGSYVKDGKDKARYENVGHVLQLDNGGEILCIKRTFSPAGVPNPDNRDTVIVSLFDVKDSSSETHKGYDKAGNGPSASDMNDEVPF
jgi:hypothetical protein